MDKRSAKEAKWVQLSREQQQARHEWYEMQPADRRLEAEYRREIMQLVEDYQKGKNLPKWCILFGRLSLTASVYAASELIRGDVSTIWRWKALIEGVSEIDWLPYLCPRKTMPVLNLPSACIIADGVK